MESHPGVDDAGGAPAWIGEWPTTNSHMYLVYTTYYAPDQNSRNSHNFSLTQCCDFSAHRHTVGWVVKKPCKVPHTPQAQPAATASATGFENISFHAPRHRK